MTKTIRAVLDAIYFGGGVLAALCLIGILVLIVLQMLARWTGEVFPGAPDYAGYAMAAASFLAFAHALNRGAHIRVSLLLSSVSPKVRRYVEIWCFAIGTALAEQAPVQLFSAEHFEEGQHPWYCTASPANSRRSWKRS